MMLDEYYASIEKEVEISYRIARAARAKGYDPKTDVEVAAAKDLAGRVEGLVGPVGIANVIRELLKTNSRDATSLRIIDHILTTEDKYESREKLAEQCVRTSLAILTEGVAVASTEGISKINFGKNLDGSDYLSIYFQGPIRAAGGTAASLAVVVSDYTRKKMGLSPFRPTETEVERAIEEVNIYHNSVARLQYLAKDDEIRQIMTNSPVSITGEPTHQIEVSVWKNVPRVESNMVRGGMCLVLSEGIAQKPAKILKFSRKNDLGWDWVEGLIKVEKKGKTGEKTKPLDLYLEDIVGGRPILAYPSAKGGFRLRYGRARNAGINARSIHPATMHVLNDFPAIGTQLKVERPGKGTAITPCDTIEGPVVRLTNGDVIKVTDPEKGKEIQPLIKEILFLGDMLVPYGDFLRANHPLLPSGIVEEWWGLMAKQKGIDVDPYKVSMHEALELSEKQKIALHPRYTYFYGDLSKEELSLLLGWLRKGDIEDIEGLGGHVKRLVLNVSEEKRILEKLCVPHIVRDGRVIIEEADPLIKTLGLGKEVNIDMLYDKTQTALEMVNQLADFPVYNKAPVYIGARMGRPEKAKERMMEPSPHGLIPLGSFGGKQRSVAKAAEKGQISVEIPKMICPGCGEDVYGYFCRKCNMRAEPYFLCPSCGKIGKTKYCGNCKAEAFGYQKKVIDFKDLVEEALGRLKEPMPDKTKGVLGTTNAKKYFEPIEKAVLRAKHGVYVFKDGTSRFDSTDLILTHFTPKEIGVAVDLLRRLGYTKDHEGKELTDENQILEIKPQDIIVSERASQYLTKVSNFVDDELEKFYGLEKHYKIKDKNDLVGQLVIGIAPHISAGVVGRIIGFTKARGTYAHPYFFCAQRRDADGDECTVMLLLDALLNLSKDFIPQRTGATMDIPIVFSTRIDPSEIDDQVHDMDIVYSYPMEFYDACDKGLNPADVKIEIVKNRLGKNNQFDGFGFTNNTSSINLGPTVSRYTTLKTMQEKVFAQLDLAEKIRAVDEKDVAARILNFHFLRDMYGNLRSFGQQKFRCTECNEKFRRVPLIGKCSRCGGKLLMTVHKGGIEKYLSISLKIAEKYGLSDYLKQRLNLISKDLEMIFQITEPEADKGKQISLADFV